MKNKLTKELVNDYFRLLFKYPIYIEMFTKFPSVKNLSNFLSSIDIESSNPIEEPSENIVDFLNDHYQAFLAAEEEVKRIESEKDYEYPTFGFEFELNKKYTEDELMETEEKIIYYSYLLKEYPQHVSDRMRILGEKFNTLIMKENYTDKILILMSGMNTELNNSDLILPAPPIRYEELIANELKFLNVKLSVERLGINNTNNRVSNGNKLKEEIKQIKQKIEETTEDNRYLTQQEAMDYLKISRTTLHRLVKSQTLHQIMIGKRKYIDKEEIDKNIAVIDGKRRK